MVSVLPLNASVSHLRHPVLQPTEAVFINFEKAQGGFREIRGRWCDYIARIRLTSSQSVEAPTETGHRRSVTNEFSDQN